MCKFVFVSLLVGFAAATQVPASTPTKPPANAQISSVYLPYRDGKATDYNYANLSSYDSVLKKQPQIIIIKYSQDGKTAEKLCECVAHLCKNRNSLDLSNGRWVNFWPTFSGNKNFLRDFLHWVDVSGIFILLLIQNYIYEITFRVYRSRILSALILPSTFLYE